MSFNLEQMDPSDKSKTSNPMPVNIMPHLLSSTNKQSAQVDLLPRFYSPIPVSISPYPYQSDFSREQAARMGILSNIRAPASVYMGFPQLSSGSSLPSIGVQNPMSVSAGSQVSASKKRPAPRQAPTKVQNSMGINQGPHQLSLVNKRPSQPGPPPKVQTESFESVRSKLRESLAASLTMVPDQQNKPQVAEKNSPKESVSTTSKAEEGMGSVELASMTSNPSDCRNSPEALASNESNAKCTETQDVPSDPDPKRNTSGQTEPRQDDVQEDQRTNVILENEMPFSTNPVINDELLQGHGLCWASDVDAGISDTIINQDLKRPKLSHEEVTEGPRSLIEEVTDDSKEASVQNAESFETKIEANLDSKEASVRNAESLVTKTEADLDSKEASVQNAESLATKIEAELFKLFGGVNKKYKEKARSLLFNLKDRSNPELRERVLSGDISPARLSSMTAEELASKELSQWRLAKAEEMAQMVVLPDSEVDIRRLVKKTHKGEFQVVEVEQDDIISMEVAVGKSVLSHVPSKGNGVQSQSKSKETEQSMPQTKASEGLPLPEKGDSGEPNDSGNLDTLLNEKADIMQDLIVDELKDTELLPPIVSLDEFMQALDSEPPFDNLSMGTNLSEKNSDNSESEMDPESDSSEPKSDPALDNLKSKLDSSEDISGSKLSPPETDSKGLEETAIHNAGKLDIICRPDNDIKSSPGHAETETYQPNIIGSRSEEHIWEGLLQLNVSVLATVIGFFRSGEKTSTQEWPSFLEIKGRVRLDAFEKFLQELPLSRSRAMMIAQFCWKEGSQESGRLNMIETANSYIADQRVGFAEPAPGVELYFCPPHPKTTEMLERHLSKDHTETLRSTVNGLVGVVVWRRPHVTTISPRLSSHHKHGNTKKQSSSRRQQQNVTNSSFTSSRHTTHPKPMPDDELIDDVPPGFGPGNARDEDDLPEFDFHSNSQQKGVAGMANSHASSLPPPSARPVEQMRELIHRYGKGDNAKKPGTGIQSWNDDDDIPEWQPHHHNQPAQQQQLPLPPPLPLPLPPPQQQLPPQPNNSYQQQTMQMQQQQLPFLVNQSLMPPPPQQQQQQQQQQLMPLGVPLPMPLQLQFNPQMGFMQGQQSMNPGWQQGGPLWPPRADVLMSLPINNGGVVMQPCHLNFSGGQPGGNGQFYGVPAAFGAVPALQNGMMGGRPPDAPRNGGV